MTTGRSKGRRHLWWIAVVLTAGFVATCAELVRRDRDRRDQTSMRSLMAQAGSGADLAQADQRWPRLQARLHAEIRVQPAGELALLAHRTAAAMRTAVPRVGRPEHPIIIVLQYGDEQALRAVLPEDQAFRWEIEVQGSWDRGPWQAIDRVSWSERIPETHRLDLREVLPEVSFAEGMHVLQLRATKQLFLPVAGAEAIHFEGTDLGRHPIQIGTPRPTAAGR
jgi:hypothetical protein